METATVLFTDLAGSTELRSRLGEDAAEELRNRHDALVVGAIEAHRGTVVKSLGDGVMATFTAAADAVAAGVAVQQAIHTHNRRGAAERLGVRVGISVGDVTFEGDDCFGLPVVEAQRLEAAAAPGTVVCADVVALLAKGRGGHAFRSLGALELKGLAEPLAASEVQWEPLADPWSDGAGLPSVLATAVGMPFAGREEVLDALTDAWKDAAAGGFGVVLLAGEPGIGKTRLAAELALTALDQGATVLAGRCDEDLHVAFQPFAAALRTFVGTVATDELPTRLGAQPADLARVVPELVSLVPNLGEPLRADPDSERFRLFEAVADWLAAAGAGAPTLLVLDDVHWADAGSLQVLRHLIERAPVGLLVVGTYRDTDVSRGHALSSVLADLRRQPAVTRLAVGGLEADEVRDLVERVGGNDLDEAGEAFARVVADESAGNPFFVGELLRHLAESGALVQREGRWTSDLSLDQLGIPEGIREVVGRRLSRLGDDTDEVLRAGAVIGYEFDVVLLAGVTGRTDDAVLDALEAALAAGLVLEVSVDRFRFAHALVRQTLHEELSSSRRARQHRRVAQALEAQYTGRTDEVLAQLALHWGEAVAGGDPTVAVDYAVRAGEQAEARLAYEEAAVFYRQALELLDGMDGAEAAPRGARILTSLGRAEAFVAAPGYADTLRRAAELALDVGDVESAIDALTPFITVNITVGSDIDLMKVALLERALAAVGDDLVLRARALAGLALGVLLSGDDARRADALDELDALLPDLPDAALRAELAARPIHGYGRTFDADAMRRRRAWIEEGLATDDPTLSLQVLGPLWFMAAIDGDRAAADRELARYERLPHQSPLVRMYTHLMSDITAMIDGDLAAAETASLEFQRIGISVDYVDTGALFAVQQFTLLRERARLAELVDLLLGALADPAAVAAVAALTAQALLAAGRTDDAAALLDDLDLSAIPDDGAYFIAVAAWAEVAARLGSPQQCADLIELVAPYAGFHLVTGAFYAGAGHRYLALLEDRRGDHAAADAHFAAAVDDHARFRTPPWLARTHLDWASSLLERGDVARAVEQLDAAEAALGSLDLPESRGRLTDLRARALGSEP